jgi:hypothetical protein
MNLGNVYNISIDPDLLAKTIVKSYSGNILNGNGMVVLEGGKRYRGKFKNGKLHGEGEFEWSDGTKYTGHFYENKITGKGVYVWFVIILLLLLFYEGVMGVPILEMLKMVYVMVMVFLPLSLV